MGRLCCLFNSREFVFVAKCLGSVINDGMSNRWRSSRPKLMLCPTQRNKTLCVVWWNSDVIEYLRHRLQMTSRLYMRYRAQYRLQLDFAVSRSESGSMHNTYACNYTTKISCLLSGLQTCQASVKRYGYIMAVKQLNELRFLRLRSWRTADLSWRRRELLAIDSSASH